VGGNGIQLPDEHESSTDVSAETKAEASQVEPSHKTKPSPPSDGFSRERVFRGLISRLRRSRGSPRE
jgi:hypothetical protein